MIDHVHLAKLTRECGFLEDEEFTSTDVDLVWARLLHQQKKKKLVGGQRHIDFHAFRTLALPELAKRKYPSDDIATAEAKLIHKMMLIHGPSIGIPNVTMEQAREIEKSHFREDFYPTVVYYANKLQKEAEEDKEEKVSKMFRGPEDHDDMMSLGTDVEKEERTP